MNFIFSTLATLTILIGAFNTLSFSDLKYLSLDYWIKSDKLGAFTEISATNQLSAFPTTYNANLGQTMIKSTTTLYEVTTADNLATTSKLAVVGTINTGVWNGTEIGAAYGGRGTVTQSQYRVVLGGGSNGLSIATSTGSAGQVFMSSGEGKNPSWQALPPTNQGDNYTWTGLHSWSQPMNASSTLLVNSRLSVATSSPSTTVNLVVNGGALISGTTTVSNLVVASTTPFRASSTIITATSTWTVPAKVKRVKIRLSGAGGAGGGSPGADNTAGGGGGGAYCEAIIEATSTLQINIGNGGYGDNVATGNSGSDTSVVGSTKIITASGGAGGTQAGAGGNGGTCTNADLSIAGRKGEANVSATHSGEGGDSVLGFGGLWVNAAVGNAGVGYGGGGSGADGTNNAGGSGTNGVAILEWIEGD